MFIDGFFGWLILFSMAFPDMTYKLRNLMWLDSPQLRCLLTQKELLLVSGWKKNCLLHSIPGTCQETEAGECQQNIGEDGCDNTRQ